MNLVFHKFYYFEFWACNAYLSVMPIVVLSPCLQWAPTEEPLHPIAVNVVQPDGPSQILSQNKHGPGLILHFPSHVYTWQRHLLCPRSHHAPYPTCCCTKPLSLPSTAWSHSPILQVLGEKGLKEVSVCRQRHLEQGWAQAGLKWL